ncbi:Nitrate/nitrite transporter, partial [hydrothermal vent metagenome]
MADIYEWDVEDEEFWETTGKKVASRNLWISIPSLLVGFSVWLYWGIITVQMVNLGFPFSTAELFTLSAIAGLTGATLRIPSSFLIRIAGGRNTIFFTTALLMIPAAGTGFALMSDGTPLWVFQMLAILSGIGGGNFASSMSNISFFYPKKKQGLALGLNAGLGNAGVTTMQILVPLVMTFGVVGVGRTLENSSGWIFGKIPAGTETFIHNGGFVWLLFLVPLAFLAWFRMDNIRAEHVSPNISGPLGSFAKISGMLGLAFIPAVAGLFIILPAPVGLGWTWAKYPTIILVIFATVMLLKLLRGDIKPNLDRQFKIFSNK